MTLPASLSLIWPQKVLLLSEDELGHLPECAVGLSELHKASLQDLGPLLPIIFSLGL